MSHHIRTARTGDATRLTELALAAKAVWGYDQAFMRLCQDELKVTPTAIKSAQNRYFVAEQDEDILGFACLIIEAGQQSELEALFVDPQYMRRGIGLALWHAVIEFAVQTGIKRIEIQSDPHALPFYEAVGCQLIGEKVSQSIPERSLPLLEYCL